MSTAAIQEEIKIKKQQLVELMGQHNLAGVMLSTNENISWATAGQVDTRILIPGSTGAAARSVVTGETRGPSATAIALAISRSRSIRRRLGSSPVAASTIALLMSR